jgi:DNA-binding transcriptional ArsR family regulator
VHGRRDALREICYLERLDQAEALLRPGRVEILRQLASPASCTDVGARLGETPQKVYYHVKRMEQAGLVDRVGDRQVRGITEGIYQASASSYWLAPTLVGVIGERRAQDEMSLGFLLSLSEELQSDLARLARSAGERPSLGLSGEVRLQPERRHEFLTDLRSAIESLLTKYGGADGAPFRIAFACYPKED